MSRALPSLKEYVGQVSLSALAPWSDRPPWELTAESAAVVQQLLAELPSDEYAFSDGVAVHRSATVEANAVLKPPLILGAGVFVASGAYLRGGCWLAERCSIGPSVELKSCFLFPQACVAHLSFIGDSVLGAQVNVESGAIICNSRNERPSGEVLVLVDGKLLSIGSMKFGALLGDGSRIGANAVLSPGTVLPRRTVVPRLSLIDHESPAPGAGG